MDDKQWVIFAIKTVGQAPTYVVDLAAQRMCGWRPVDEPFRRLINHGLDAELLPPDQIALIERDGYEPSEVYRKFRDYGGSLPIVSYDLKRDLDDVLASEWTRLNINPSMLPGFSVKALARRLLDPIPMDTVSLQAICRFYSLPENIGDGAAGTVLSVIELLKNVLSPLLNRAALRSWQDIIAFVESEWFPSKITFGKYKGRDFNEAAKDKEFRNWLEWLSNASNKQTANMGKWYLSRLVEQEKSPEQNSEPSSRDFSQTKNQSTVIIEFNDPAIERLRVLISAAQSRLADLSATYTREKRAVDLIQSELFKLVRDKYEERDRLRLVIIYREKFIAALVDDGEEQAEIVAKEYQSAREQSYKSYQKAFADASNQRKLTSEEEEELNRLWRKLVRLYHPDRYASDPQKMASYEKLTAVINLARDQGDIELLRKIASDPEAFIAERGWTSIDFSEECDLGALRKLYSSLQAKILELIGALDALQTSQEYELYTMVRNDPALLQSVAQTQRDQLDLDIAELMRKADLLQKQIEMMTDNEGSSIA